ncbi:MAG TPA: hydantoinase/oxoprolinase family protein [Clostridiaceae bacterium]|nr:hydantoinase/oxoprolinase family protein [Clostridiaceae bacterium]
MKIGIGIDTGGTYTDAVAYDFSTKTVLGSAKALTTKDDLSIGILEALDGLPKELLQRAEIISLSTTLATNACVENKGGNAKLIFFGGNKKVIDELGGKYGLPKTEDIYIQESYTRFSGEIEREPDWELFSRHIEKGYEHYDGVAIVEINAMKNGAVIEKKAKSIFQKKYDIPVICGHELFSELNCLQRASSTLLNAQLFPVIKELLDAIKVALIKRGINPALVIVRSDGSMMSEKYALDHPVETILCGPAASAIGALNLCRESNSIVIDMGGTTTDICLIKNNLPVTTVEGVSIGKWKTFVDGLYVKTVGLGGDSAIHYDSRRIFLEDYRIVPLCVAAEKYPVVVDNLKKLLSKKRKHTKYLYEHFILTKNINDNQRYTEEEKAFCRILENGPVILSDAAKAAGKDIYNLNVSRLIKDGVVQVCGFTPTDIMHIKKDFTRYSVEASLLAAEFVAHNLETSVEELCDMVYDEVKRKLYLNIVKVLLENKHPYYMRNGVGSEVEQFINESYEMARTGKIDSLISMTFNTEFSLVGIGAPIRIFLEDVAKMLKTRAVIPENFEVANALGAIAGNVTGSHAVEIRPNNTSEGTAGYTVFGNAGNRFFEKFEDAVEFAVHEAKEGAKKKAINRGATGNITVTCDVRHDSAKARNGIVYLGTTVTANAVGSIRF